MTSLLYRTLGIVSDWDDFVAYAKANKGRVNIYTNYIRAFNRGSLGVFNVEAFSGRKKFELMRGECTVDAPINPDDFSTYSYDVARQLRNKGLEVSVNDVPFSPEERRQQIPFRTVLGE